MQNMHANDTHKHTLIYTAKALACLKGTLWWFGPHSSFAIWVGNGKVDLPCTQTHVHTHAHTALKSLMEPAGSQTALTCCLWQPKRRRLAPSSDNMLFVSLFLSLSPSAISCSICRFCHCSFLPLLDCPSVFFDLSMPPCHTMCPSCSLTISVFVCLLLHFYVPLMPLWSWE